MEQSKSEPHTSSTTATFTNLPDTVDNAFLFLWQHNTSIPATPPSLRRLRRKIDILVISFLTMTYTLNFLDKVFFNYSRVTGITASLNLFRNEFTNAASAFYIATAVAVIPNIFLLQKIPTGKYLAFSLLCWGVCTTCHAALRNYAGLVSLRVLSGMFEAAIPPSLMLISSQYFTRKEQALRFAYWYCGLGLGQIFGGLISFGFQHVENAPFESWRYMFLAVGLFTVLFSVGVCFIVPDSPMKAWFLDDAEIVALLQHVKSNQTGIENSKWHLRQVLEGLFDFQVWCMAIILILQGTGGGVVTTYSSTLLVSFGFTAKRSALLLIPAGAVNILSSLFGGFGPRYFGNRWLVGFILCAGGIAGACMMAFLPHSSRGGLLASIYLVNILPGAGPVDYQWVMGNTAGHSKRAFVSAAMNGAFAIGNIIGPQTFQAKDAPQYEPAKVSLVATWSASAGMVLVLAVYYLGMNHLRNRETAAPGQENEDEDVSDLKAFEGLTDKQNKLFRYRY